MLRDFFKTRKKNEKIIQQLYNMIVSQARHETFYKEYGVPDTLEGRFNMIVLHIFFLFHRLKEKNDRSDAIKQDLLDVFCLDMDRSLRELGISDIRVPKQMKKVLSAFYESLSAYEHALKSADNPFESLRAALLDRIFDVEETDVTDRQLTEAYKDNELHNHSLKFLARHLARYSLDVIAHLKSYSDDDMAAGGFFFPEAEQIPSVIE